MFHEQSESRVSRARPQVGKKVGENFCKERDYVTVTWQQWMSSHYCQWLTVVSAKNPCADHGQGH